MWPFLNTNQQLSPQVMTLPMKQSFNSTINNNNNNNLAHNFDLNFFAAAAVLQQQQQQQQQEQYQQQIQQQNRKTTTNPFTSSFSVNSLLAPFISQTQNHSVYAKNVQNLIPQQQQIAAAVFSQHIAAAVANYRIQQERIQNNQQNLTNETVVQPPNKKYKSDINYETYSISSPSSSSTSSLLSSTTVSINDICNEVNNNNLDNMNNTKSQESTSSSLSSSFLNDSSNNEIRNERNTPDNIRNSSFVRRSSRKRNSIDLQNPCCPICGLSLRLNDLQSHIDLELEKLEKLTNNSNSNNMQNINNNCNTNIDLPLNSNNQLINISNNIPCNRKRTSSGNERSLSTSFLSTHQNEANYKSRYLNYLRIKENRQIRLKSKMRIRVRETDNGTLICPICIEPLKGTKNEINLHLENCSSRNGSSDGEKDIDIESTAPTTSSINEVFEEYEWAGQKRIRTISLLNNPAKELGAVNIRNEEYDGELNVDSDDRVDCYGKSQFNESDIIPMPSEDGSAEILRKAIIGNNNENDDENTDSSENSENKIHNIKNDNSKCLICMEPYVNALVSVNCWHVYCKQCWLQSLGAKKLCPQCNVITTAEDLRRIFL